MNEFKNKTFSSDLYAFAALLYKLSRKERIERRWSIYLHQKNSYEMIPNDVAWFRPKEMGTIIYELFNENPKNRPKASDVAIRIQEIQKKKGLNTLDFIKIKYLEKRRKNFLIN